LSKQLELFRRRQPTSRQILDLVRDRLYGFKVRQAARDERRRQKAAAGRKP